MGGQFVAFGPHAATGQPYEWENWDSQWPRLSSADLQRVLAEVPARAGTSLRFSAEHETAGAEELAEAVPRNQSEWQAGRDAAKRYLGMLKQELLGKHDGRGSTIFAIVGVLKFAAMHGMCTLQEIEDAITEAGHDLDSGLGGRTLREEIQRHEQLPVLRGNLIMQAIMSSRTLTQGAIDAQTAPTMAARTGFEISLEDDTAELPWLLYQRILAGEIHFFTGHSGAGKSTVVSDLVLHYLSGRPWLDADIERTDGHVLWIAAEDDYGTERRLRHLMRQEPNGQALADRFHLIRGAADPLAFEQNCVAQVQFMATMGKRVDIIALDTWGASGLCFADNDTESVLKAMFTLKQVTAKTKAAVLVTDHLPLGNEDAWQKGNGAKSGNSGFMYRITAGKGGDLISIDCGKARGAPKAKSYTGKLYSENYGTDRKGRTTTVNVFRREQSAVQRTQSVELRLGAMLPGAQQGMDALRMGSIVTFESVAADIGQFIKGAAPPYVMTLNAAKLAFGDDFRTLTESGYISTISRTSFLAVYPPKGAGPQSTTINWTIQTPTTKLESFPWQ